MFFAFKRTCLVLALCLNGALFCSAQKPAYARPLATYVTFEVPHSNGTFPTSINNELTVAGYYNDDIGSEGFVRDISGKIETFKVARCLPRRQRSMIAAKSQGSIKTSPASKAGLFARPQG